MKHIRLNSGVVMRLVDKDMTGALLQQLINIVSDQCGQMFPLPPSPTSISESMPGSGWYVICSSDIKTSVAVTQYDPGTYVRFVLQDLLRDAMFVVYRIETGRVPLDSLIPDVTMTEASEVVAQAIELPAAESCRPLAVPEFQAAAESLFKMQQHHGQSAKSPSWTPEQLDKLRLAVEKYGRRWKLIVTKFDFGGLTSQHLCSKWNELLKSAQVSGRQEKSAKASGSFNESRGKPIPQFTTREVALLCKAVAEHGQDWVLIAKQYDFSGSDASELQSIWMQLQNVDRHSN